MQLIKVIIKSKDFNLLQQQTDAVRRLVSDRCREILGPVWCTKKTDTLKKQYLLFKVDSAHYLDVLARLDSFKTDKKTALQIAADPYNFF